MPTPRVTSPWLTRLQDRLDQQARLSLRRELPAVDTRPGIIDLRHNDYLGLRHHPALADALTHAAHHHGTGSGASRLLADHDLITTFEDRWCAFKGSERALLLPTGYMANLAALGSLAMPGDLILLDRLAHASLLDAARLATASVPRVTWRTFPHNDASRAEAIAHRHRQRHPDAAILLATEAVFSMDGDLGDLAALARVRDRLNRPPAAACLIVDEAHATGVIGPAGTGLDHALHHPADLVVATGGKALGVMGGIISGPAVAIDAVVNFARPFIYSTGAMPAQAAALTAALDLLRDEPQRITRLHTIITEVRARLREAGWGVADPSQVPTPVIPLIAGEAEAALELAAALRRHGILAPAIRPPTVPRGSARVRLSLHANLGPSEIDRLIDAANSCFPVSRHPTL
ncbi:MAG: aminotransferase class I/II-fold pyridoxal phosphate-dependent enzyme [Phycisphaerales bacterium]|nr:aminotransferase class I/II-fold pyridoxal phosphate-dependent enzyme [Phycisphaerales bacterium]